MSKNVSSGVVLSQDARDQLVPTPKSVQESQLATLVAEKLIPPGTIIEFAGPTAPEGFLVCDGSPVDKTLFANLFNKIGYKWGNPGGNDFNIPDLRGRTTRMQDLGAGNDPDAGSRTPLGDGAATDVGSIQGDSMEQHGHFDSISINNTGSAHSHNISDPGHVHRPKTDSTASGGSAAGFAYATTDGVGVIDASTTLNTNPQVTSISVLSTGSPPLHTHGKDGSVNNISGAAAALETRMKNAYVNKCIKY